VCTSAVGIRVKVNRSVAVKDLASIMVGRLEIGTKSGDKRLVGRLVLFEQKVAVSVAGVSFASEPDL
jgi:hypothetical protein